MWKLEAHFLELRKFSHTCRENGKTNCISLIDFWNFQFFNREESELMYASLQLKITKRMYVFNQTSFHVSRIDLIHFRDNNKKEKEAKPNMDEELLTLPFTEWMFYQSLAYLDKHACEPDCQLFGYLFYSLPTTFYCNICVPISISHISLLLSLPSSAHKRLQFVTTINKDTTSIHDWKVYSYPF